MRDQLRTHTLLSLLLLLSVSPVLAADDDDAEVAARSWLLLGPARVALPAFHADDSGAYSLSDLLEASALPFMDRSPHAGDEVVWEPGLTLEWEEATTSRDGAVVLQPDAGIEEAYLATTLEVPRFTSLTLAVRSHHLLEVLVDGASVATQSSATPAPDEDEPKGKKNKKKESPEPGEATAELDLDPGLHIIIVKTLRDPDSPTPWSVSAAARSSGEDALPEGITFRSSGSRPVELAQLLEAAQPASVAISPDGALVAIVVRRIIPGTDHRESWVEVRRVEDGSLERTYRGTALGAPRWAPVGRRLSYVTRDDDAATLWVADLAEGEVRPILERVEQFGSYRWAPDGRSVIYGVGVEPDENELGVQRLWGLQDRQAGWRDRTYLHQVSVPDGARRRLTAGELTTSLHSISPDGKRILFSRTRDDYQLRPYLREQLHLLHLGTLEMETVYDGHFLGTASWSPDGKSLLVMAGPSAFEGAGADLPEGAIPNDYDEQLFLLHLEDGRVEPLSIDFDPSIDDAVWHRDGKIYLTAVDGEYTRLYRLDPASRIYTPLESGVDVIGDLAVALDAPVAVFTGAGATTPPRVMALELDRGPAVELLAPGSEAYRDVEFGAVEEWSFHSRRGATIQGRVYYPPDFDPEGRYPAIVYYYGGTFPTQRTFGGRYPKNWWAGKGYVVYVLQPSGAVGFGQQFSALHVNDWGDLAGGDILEGVEKFLQAHPFVDPERVGCIGASYGGFMTQWLLTRTERFAACVSHAGISFLGSYWGEGYWGYAYSAVATAEAFPWNRGDIYVGKSPLFHADKIRTPLLLLHGAEDTNVPPGESEQLYTALKLLERPVEYVKIEGQNHHILKHDQRLYWSRTIVAWFDKWLKDEPEWWEHLYPGPGDQED